LDEVDDPKWNDVLFRKERGDFPDGNMMLTDIDMTGDGTYAPGIINLNALRYYDASGNTQDGFTIDAERGKVTFAPDPAKFSLDAANRKMVLGDITMDDGAITAKKDIVSEEGFVEAGKEPAAPECAGGQIGRIGNSTALCVNGKWRTGMTPAGSIIAAPMNAVEGYILCDGRSLSVAAYPALYAAIGTTFGGNGTNFNVPDYRGMFLRGQGGNSAPNFTTIQGDAIRNIWGRIGRFNFNLSTLNGAGCSHLGCGTGIVYNDHFENFGGANRYLAHIGIESGGLQFAVYINAALMVPTANENRPVNMAVNYFIKH
jgi:hypothetical protein